MRQEDESFKKKNPFGEVPINGQKLGKMDILDINIRPLTLPLLIAVFPQLSYKYC